MKHGTCNFVSVRKARLYYISQGYDYSHADILAMIERGEIATGVPRHNEKTQETVIDSDGRFWIQDLS